MSVPGRHSRIKRQIKPQYVDAGFAEYTQERAFRHIAYNGGDSRWLDTARRGDTGDLAGRIGGSDVRIKP